MSVSRVDRVHLRCLGPQSRERDALALRERLAATARTHLPSALEHRLGGARRRVFVERVGHQLDFDPAAYDDVTVATLWADAIAREVDRAGAAEAGVRVFADDESFAAAAVVEVARSGVLPWWFEELPCGAGRVPARLVLAALAEPAHARAALRALAAQPAAALAFARRLEPYERALLEQVLEGALSWRALGLSPTAARAAVVDATAAAAAEAAAAAQPDPRGPDTSPGPSGNRSSRRSLRSHHVYAPASAPTAAEVVQLLSRGVGAGLPALRFDEPAAAGARALRHRTSAEQAQPREARARPEPGAPSATAAEVASPHGDETLSVEQAAWWTTAGGLVYLYPWLGALLESCEQPERLQLLRTLVEPEADEPLADPFVRLLAGYDPRDEPAAVLPAGEQTLAAHAARAEATLRSFAALLPGFELSSPPYLRAYVVRRGGLLDPLVDGSYRLLLEPGPLDPALERLPYPLAAFRLPWAPLVEPERRRA